MALLTKADIIAEQKKAFDIKTFMFEMACSDNPIFPSFAKLPQNGLK